MRRRGAGEGGAEIPGEVAVAGAGASELASASEGTGESNVEVAVVRKGDVEVEAARIVRTARAGTARPAGRPPGGSGGTGTAGRAQAPVRA
jgi:hypothetical protein